eukprot:gene28863-32051_t
MNRFLGVPLYELVQIHAYMIIFGAKQSIHVENYMGETRETIIPFDEEFWDSDGRKNALGVLSGQTTTLRSDRSTEGSTMSDTMEYVNVFKSLLNGVCHGFFSIMERALERDAPFEELVKTLASIMNLAGTTATLTTIQDDLIWKSIMGVLATMEMELSDADVSFMIHAFRSKLTALLLPPAVLPPAVLPPAPGTPPRTIDPGPSAAAARRAEENIAITMMEMDTGNEPVPVIDADPFPLYGNSSFEDMFDSDSD